MEYANVPSGFSEIESSDSFFSLIKCQKHNDIPTAGKFSQFKHLETVMTWPAVWIQISNIHYEASKVRF